MEKGEEIKQEGDEEGEQTSDVAGICFAPHPLPQTDSVCGRAHIVSSL